ncbi:uncharacterized protein TRIADDRAFT_55035 [Trichoplax adhaerens]|uniref:Transmembrane protein n=1 Tax=Trichoplax adhaerens TaxID=10228 RepID=B3RQL9_TRIAD|nr:predicted protein [Trichoplax adhaerens]EDV26716.1 predicted protein [Trichoplax adhaerens]|eukprot:XP_002110712.1 predicted protein [Trichoplax adhaerens]
MSEKPNVTTNRINYRPTCHDIEKRPAAAMLSKHPKNSRSSSFLMFVTLSIMAISIATLAILFHMQRIELIQIRQDIHQIATQNVEYIIKEFIAFKYFCQHYSMGIEHKKFFNLIVSRECTVVALIYILVNVLEMHIESFIVLKDGLNAGSADISKYQGSQKDTTAASKRRHQFISTTNSKATTPTTPNLASSPAPDVTPSKNATSTPTGKLNATLTSLLQNNVNGSTTSLNSTESSIQKQKATSTPYEYFRIRTKDKTLVYVTRIDSKVDNLDNKVTKLHSYMKRSIKKLLKLHQTSPSSGKNNSNKDKDTDEKKEKDKISGSDFLDMLNKNSKLKDKD